MKKFLMIVLVTMITATVFGGGGSQNVAPAPASNAPYDPNKVLDIVWLGFNNPGILPVEGSILQKEFEQRYNIRITNVQVDVYNAEQVNLMIASGLEFDIATRAVGGNMTNLVENGIIRPLPMELVNQYAPDFVKVFEESMPGKWQAFTSIDGVLYGFPQLSGGRPPYGLSLRTDWLKNLGVTTLPKTLDELEALLVRFRNEDPDKNGQKDTYGLGSGGGVNNLEIVAPYLFASYGVNITKWGIDKDGSPLAWQIQPEYREALARMRQWWDKEIFDPEIIVNTRDDNYTRFASGRTAGFFGVDWQLQPTATNAFDAWLMLLNNRADLDEATMATHIPPVAGPRATATIKFSNELSSNWAHFGRNTPDEKVIRILTMFNDILTKRDLYMLMYFGIEGQHYDLDASGRAIVRPEWNSPEKRTELGAQRFYNHSFFTGELLFYSYTPGRWDSFNKTQPYPVLPLHFINDLASPADREYGASASPIASEFFWKTVTGEWDVNREWDSYVNRWKNAGGQEIIDDKKALAASLGN